MPYRFVEDLWMAHLPSHTRRHQDIKDYVRRPVPQTCDAGSQGLRWVWGRCSRCHIRITMCENCVNVQVRRQEEKADKRRGLLRRREKERDNWDVSSQVSATEMANFTPRPSLLEVQPFPCSPPTSRPSRLAVLVLGGAVEAGGRGRAGLTTAPRVARSGVCVGGGRRARRPSD